MPDLNFENIPEELRAREQWVLWKIVERDGQKTKLPYQVNGSMAKSNDASTWSDFGAARAALTPAYSGLGFVFAEDDPFCGIDLDGCRDVESGKVADWARAIIIQLASYAEVSPSQTGVKIWVRGQWPYSHHKTPIADVPAVSDKQAAIEVYDKLRYFAVTGQRLQGMNTIGDRQPEIDALHVRFWPETAPVGAAPQSTGDFRSPASVFERARKYMTKLPPSVSGQGGHNAAFHAACVAVHGFGLSGEDAYALVAEWNTGCQPPWNERELRHKIASAEKQPGERNYLRNVEPKNFDKVPVPIHKEPPAPAPPPKSTTLHDAALKYLNAIRNGSTTLIETGVPELDYSIGGGVELGELMLLAGRPSHGKSAVALQMIHHWTLGGLPVVFISEEMSAIALGKRVVQFATDVPQEHWGDREEALAEHVDKHFHDRAACRVIENCRTVDVAANGIRAAVAEIKAKCAVIDYAQLLESRGKSRYEQVTQTSMALRQIASETGVVVLALCQVSREIEKRDRFMPKMSDLKETGQLEQDADVIVFGVWPHRIDPTKNPRDYQFFIAKNRNRPINQNAIECRFDPARQKFLESLQGPAQTEFPDFNETVNHGGF